MDRCKEIKNNLMQTRKLGGVSMGDQSNRQGLLYSLYSVLLFPARKIMTIYFYLFAIFSRNEIDTFISWEPTRLWRSEFPQFTLVRPFLSSTCNTFQCGI
jgi:hypothetical protein